MKKRLLLALGFSGCLSAIQAQSLQSTDVEIINDHHLRKAHINQNKSASCGPDSVWYAISKATGLSTIAINNATSAQAAAQYFDCPQPITVSGGSFYAFKVNTTGGISMNVSLAIYLAGADSLPTGSPLASTSVAVDTAFGGGSLSVLIKHGNFTPVTVSQPYCMVVTNASATSMSMVMSSYADGDGGGEWLGSAQLGATWLHGYELTIGGSSFDADVLIEPFVTYDLTAGFDMDAGCIPANGSGTWTNTSSPIMSNRMYNQAAFIGMEELSYSWDYGDGSALGNTIDGSYTYSGPGPWMVTLTDTLYGWTTTCVDAYSMTTGDQVDADFTFASNGLSVDFTDVSVGPNIQSYAWDFGDGNTDGNMNPSHTYAAPGTYTACLIASSACNADTTCLPVSVIVTGISEQLNERLTVYPNPTEGDVTLELNNIEARATINLFDISGRVVYTEGVFVGKNFKKTLDLNVVPGSYILQLITEEGIATRKLEVR